MFVKLLLTRSFYAIHQIRLEKYSVDKSKLWKVWIEFFIVRFRFGIKSAFELVQKSLYLSSDLWEPLHYVENIIKAQHLGTQKVSIKNQIEDKEQFKAFASSR